MEKECVGKVTIEEKNEIQSYFIRKMGLVELINILKSENSNHNSSLYEEVVNDLGEMKLKMENWWSSKSNKYQWKSVVGGMWNIDFDTCEIFLVQQAAYAGV